MNSLFPPELRTAAVVKRWSVVRVFQPDSVAEHSFFVTYYALQIARLIIWSGPYADLTFAAMMDDVEETFLGDIVSPVKHAITDDGKMDGFISDHMKQRLPLVEAQLAAIADSKYGPAISLIVKVADKIDAVLYLITEMRMGNAVLQPLYEDALKNLSEAWTALGLELHGGDIPQSHAGLWNDDIWPAIQTHWKHGGIGVQ